MRLFMAREKGMRGWSGQGNAATWDRPSLRALRCDRTITQAGLQNLNDVVIGINRIMRFCVIQRTIDSVYVRLIRASKLRVRRARGVDVRQLRCFPKVSVNGGVGNPGERKS